MIPKWTDVEPIPPPLPPLRCTSLANGAGHQNTKPLPMIPCSVSAHELDTSESLGSIIGGNHIDRPLPPLPRGNSLKMVSESASSGSNSDEDDDDDVADRDDKEEPLVGSESSDLDTDENMDDSTNRVAGNFDADATLPPSPTEKTNTANVSSEIGYVILFFNATLSSFRRSNNLNSSIYCKSKNKFFYISL